MKKSIKKLKNLFLVLSLALVFAQVTTPVVSQASVVGKISNAPDAASKAQVTEDNNGDVIVTYQNTTALKDKSYEEPNKAMSEAVYNNTTSVEKVGITCEQTGLKVNPTTWGQLSREDQKAALEALAGSEYYNSISSDDRSQIVEALEQCSGTKDGTVLMTILFGNTKPDWAGAYKIIEPFNGPIGKILGVVTLVCAFCLVGVMLCDIFYMTIPWVRVKGDAKDVRWVSHAAIQAIEKCETTGEDGKGQVLWEYLKHRAVMLFLFGICILYLICGKIFNIIGWFMDLASGTL